MRLIISFLVLFAAAGTATIVQAGCIACPEGYGYWHSKEACVPKIEGFVGTPPPETWVPPLRNHHSGGDPDVAYGKSAPQTDR